VGTKHSPPSHGRSSDLLRTRSEEDLQSLAIPDYIRDLVIRELLQHSALERSPHSRLVEAVPMGHHRMVLLLEHRVFRRLLLRRHQVHDQELSSRSEKGGKHSGRVVDGGDVVISHVTLREVRLGGQRGMGTREHVR
jgi:hypothetical protein